MLKELENCQSISLAHPFYEKVKMLLSVLGKLLEPQIDDTAMPANRQLSSFILLVLLVFPLFQNELCKGHIKTKKLTCYPSVTSVAGYSGS